MLCQGLQFDQLIEFVIAYDAWYGTSWTSDRLFAWTIYAAYAVSSRNAFPWFVNCQTED